MQHSAPKSRRWALICSAIAAVYAILVAFAVWSNFPTESRIDADTASSAVAALQQSEPKYKSLTREALRRRLYRGLSDREVIQRVREYAATEEQRVTAQGGKVSVQPQEGATGLYSGSLLKEEAPPALSIRPQIALVMEELDKQHAERLAALPGQQTKAIAWGIAAWLIPVAALFMLVPRLSGPRRKRMRRI
jgi:hypothetical protein